MIDYLFVFGDEAAAAAALPQYRVDGAWDASCVLPIRLGVGHEAGPDDEDGTPTRIAVYAAGYWLVVSTAAPDDPLWAVPACMREADRDAANAGRPFVLRDRFSPEQLAMPYWITPTWAGARYPFQPSAAE